MKSLKKVRNKQNNFENHLDSDSGMRRPIIGKAGIIILIVIGVFLLWGAFVPLSQGVVASGMVVVDSKRKTIQHLEGGVIAAIHVKEGSRVAQGDVLIELDSTRAKAEYDVVHSRYLSKLASVDRLIALIEGKTEISFSKELNNANEKKDVAELLHINQRLFQVLILEHEGKKSINKQRIDQLEQKLRGLNSYQKIAQQQIDLLNKEIKRLTGLQQNRLVEETIVVERMQQLSQLQGDFGKTISDIAETQIAIGEAKLTYLQIEREWQQDLAKQLSETREAMIELQSQLRAAQNVLDRTLIKAPISGTVLALKATTIGGVLTTGNPIMDIVPEGDMLTIDAYIRPLDIDSVYQGMRTYIKFTSFKSKLMPSLEGVVENISADVLSDPNRRESYYLIRIAVAGNELEELQDIEIIPGMPVEVYADGGSRTMLQYLFDPISGLMRRSLREE
jgi:membrane fusion protein, epimerase transport system